MSSPHAVADSVLPWDVELVTKSSSVFDVSLKYLK